MALTVWTLAAVARVVLAVGRAILVNAREVLPSTEDELAPWFGGFCTSFVLHWLMLLLVTWLWSISR